MEKERRITFVWQSLKNLVLRLFGVKIPQTDESISRQNQWALGYEDAADINFTAIFASRLASLAVSDSSVTVDGGNRRAKLIQEVLDRCLWPRKHAIVSAALGCGGVALVPYLANGRIYLDTVNQNRLFISERQGDEITKCTVLSSMLLKDNRKYWRLTDYALENGIYIIRNKAVRDTAPCNLAEVPEWAAIPEEIRIGNVKRILIGFLKCPADNRHAGIMDGVPITYGCEKQMEDIRETLRQVAREYDLKRCFIGADETLFGRDEQLPHDGLFRKFSGSGETDLWHEFSPEIRTSAYSTRLQEQFALLEKQVGTSKGILTSPDPATTATEVRRAQHDTFALVSSIRAALERAVNETAYAVDVLANYAGLSPAGDYTVKIDWDMSLMEDTAQTWQQMKDAQAIGAMEKAELRAWVTGETLEEAQTRIAAIRESEPTMSDIIGKQDAG